MPKKSHCPKCGSTKLRINYEEMITFCDGCGLTILAIPMPVDPPEK